jgi:hypothetical protein
MSKRLFICQVSSQAYPEPVRQLQYFGNVKLHDAEDVESTLVVLCRLGKCIPIDLTKSACSTK